MAVQRGPGCLIGHATRIVVPRGDEPALAAARWLQGELDQSSLWHLPIVVGNRKPVVGAIVFASTRETADDRAAGRNPEAYRLAVTASGVTIRATDRAGLFYGAVSLWQLLSPNDPGQDVNLPALTIADQPRFAWRGLMLDSARHMQSVAYIERFLDWMALHKFNRLHWHLTDDQGWRIPIAGFPRLTTVGAWRKPMGPDAWTAQGQPLARYGGFYTAEQIRAVVAFAAQRHITIVPELDMPGHATALLSAYPELAVPGIVPEAVTADYGLLPGVLNIDEPTIARIESILTQVMALFPGQYIHLGGDEVDKSEWHGSPQVQARMRSLGLADEDSLERWFIGRLGTFLEAHGRRLIGWDEIQNGAPGSAQDQQAIIMSWHGGQGAAQAILSGHQVIIAQAPIYYFDNRQNASLAGPPGWTDIETTRSIYLHDPVPAGLSPVQAEKVLGVQGQMFTERARKEDWITRQVWPRAAALAEVGWSPPIACTPGLPRNAVNCAAAWPDFARRLAVQRTRYPLVGLIDGQTPDGAAVTASGADERTSLDLDLCAANGTGLVIEAPHGDRLVEEGQAITGHAMSSQGARPLVMFSIRQLCWAWRGANLGGIRHIDLGLVHVPFNERLGSDAPILHLAKRHTPAGEIEVHADRIDGPLLGSLPLAAFAPDAVDHQATLTLGATAPELTGPHDLYFVITGQDIDTRLQQRPPVTVIASVGLH